MKKHLLKYYLTGWVILIFLISLLALRGLVNSSVIFKDYLLGVLVCGTVLIILFVLTDIFTFNSHKYIKKTIATRGRGKTNLGNVDMELALVVTALDELVAWSMKGDNNPDVLDSAKVIENYLGVRQ